VALIVGVVGGWATRGMGFTTRHTPSKIETVVARAARHWAVPASIRDERNPVSSGADALHEGLEHWADHCAICHANDGSGMTAVGRTLYPPVPDVRQAETQQLSDGELFYIIERGVPITGMPGWSNGTPEGEQASWRLVLFIRHLPAISSDELREMASLNPTSPADARRHKDIDDFLNGPPRIGR
jgi:mono/diheme cytochrome c family protein